LLIMCTILSLPCFSFFVFSWTRPPPISTLFPYTTLFRSDATWNSVEQKIARLESNPVASKMTAVKNERYLTIPFPASEAGVRSRSEEHTSELQSRFDLVCRLLLEKKKKKTRSILQENRSH